MAMVTKGILTAPDKPTIVASKELKKDIFRTNKDCYLWVDITGLKLIDTSRYHEIVSWTVEQDQFRLGILESDRSRTKDMFFITGHGKALELKTALEEYVKIHMQQPEVAEQLSKLAVQTEVGSLVPKQHIQVVEPFGSGVFVDLNSATGSSRRRFSNPKTSPKGSISSPTPLPAGTSFTPKL
eukprot:gene23874-28966_t